MLMWKVIHQRRQRHLYSRSEHITGHSEPRQGTPEEYGKPVFRDRQNHIFFKNANRGLIHLLNVCHPGRSACRLLIISRGIAAFVCPSNLGEYSLVRLLFFQNLHWVFGYGLQCLGPEELSGNILVSENCDFFYTISFAGF